MFLSCRYDLIFLFIVVEFGFKIMYLFERMEIGIKWVLENFVVIVIV